MQIQLFSDLQILSIPSRSDDMGDEGNSDFDRVMGFQRTSSRAVCTITADDARTIFISKKYQTKRDGLACTMARQFGITPKAVRDIWNLRTWRKETEPHWSTKDAENFVNRRLCFGCKDRGFTRIQQACEMCRNNRAKCSRTPQYLDTSSSASPAAAAAHSQHARHETKELRDESGEQPFVQQARCVSDASMIGTGFKSTSNSRRMLLALAVAAASHPALYDHPNLEKITTSSLEDFGTPANIHVADNHRNRSHVHALSHDQEPGDMLHCHVAAQTACSSRGRSERGPFWHVAPSSCDLVTFVSDFIGSYTYEPTYLNTESAEPVVQRAVKEASTTCTDFRTSSSSHRTPQDLSVAAASHLLLYDHLTPEKSTTSSLRDSATLPDIHAADNYGSRHHVHALSHDQEPNDASSSQPRSRLHIGPLWPVTPSELSSPSSATSWVLKIPNLWLTPSYL